MRKESAIIITIGEKGTIFTVHNAKNISTKIFFETFDSEVKKSLSQILSKNKSQNIYITFDTLDQSFKKKNFPAIKKADLKLLIKREIDNDPDKESLKNYTILSGINDQSAVKSSQVMFISSSISKNAKELIEFIYELPNRLIGIYLSPIESISLINSIDKFHNKTDKKSLSEAKISCLVTKTKVSGMRQSIYHNDQILFTRLLDYDSSSPEFVKRYEKDLYASFEYLKRIFPEISITKFHITNILSKNAIALISKMTNIEFNINNYTPSKISQIIDPSLKVNEDVKNSDIVISRSFFQTKKRVLRFTTKEIIRSLKMYIFMKLSYFTNLLILLCIGALSISSISKISKSEEMVNTVKLKKLNSANELSHIEKKLTTRELEIQKKYQGQATGSKIVDIGQISENFDETQDAPFTEYMKLKFLKKYNVEIKHILYKVNKFNISNVKKQKYSIVIEAQIINKSGDVDELFTKYDILRSGLEKKYKKYKLTINELPKNINLAKKYYSFNVKINISNKR